MEYPIWFIPSLGGGLIIAVISIIHVFIAHFAVGGGLFLVLTEHKARRENSPVLLEYVRRHTRFFLLLTMVLGGLTGVGIWFAILLNAPQATSTLIHTFVFAFATEWVFFLAEIASLLVYYYTFKKMRARDHLFVGWAYFAFAWLSLFVITGIITFMLSPGGWQETGNVWQAFFNPTFWPAVVFRTCIALTFAGLFAFLTTAYIRDETARESMARYSTIWVAAPFLFLLASGWWYLQALPPAQQAMVLAKSTEIPPYLKTFLVVSPLILLGGLLWGLALPNRARKATVWLLLLLGLAQIGAFEFVREAGRRPYVIWEHTWSSSIRVDQLEQVNRDGMLATAKWVRNRKITPENVTQAGEDIYSVQCLPCHSRGGPLLDVAGLSRRFAENGPFGMASQLQGQGRLLEYMPPFAGTAEERDALATHIAMDVHGWQGPGPAFEPPQLPVEIPPFDPDADEYVLLAWNNLGMHCISDSDPWWVLLPPANDLWAMLIRRDMLPEIVTEGVEIRYAVQEGFEDPAAHVRFWEFDEPLFGVDLPRNVGLAGKGLAGHMEPKDDQRAWAADLVPVVPYPDGGGYNPYPLFTVEAVDEQSGEVLARTRMVAPTSTEMGCRNCHGGDWRVESQEGVGVAGFSERTSRGVLEAHDHLSGTNLLEEAENGQPRLCQSCHADPVLGTEGREGLLNFPAAIHGWHANYLTGMGTEACFTCHPADSVGSTGCLRGVHGNRGLDCTSCHGYLEDHALSLLKHEQQAGKPGAARLMKHLQPRSVDSVEDVEPRVPWLMEPDCTSCHDFQEKPDVTASAFNKWTSGEPGDLYRLRTDQMGAVMCEGCHGSTHAVYPASNLFGADRDNIPPLQYQGLAAAMGAQGNCAVCHTMDMGFSAHHPIPGQ